MNRKLNEEIVEFLKAQRARDTLDYPVYPAPPPLEERVPSGPGYATITPLTMGEQRCIMGQCQPQDHPHGGHFTVKPEPATERQSIRDAYAAEIAEADAKFGEQAEQIIFRSMLDAASKPLPGDPEPNIAFGVPRSRFLRPSPTVVSGPSEPASALWADDPLGQPGGGIGKKNDAGKAQMTRLGMVSRALADVARVQEYGSKKYPSPDNWKHVPEGSKRYRDAAMRHIMADLSGESHDPETGLTHAAHAACNLLIAAEHDMGFPEIGAPPIATVPEGAIRPHWRF